MEGKQYMKRVIRIILSPLVFICVMGGMTAIPIGFLCLYMGLVYKFYCWITDKSHTSDNPEWWFVFAWVTMPWYTAKKFIRGEPLE